MNTGAPSICALAVALALASPAGAGVADGAYRDRPVIVAGGDVPGAATRGLAESGLAGYRWEGAWIDFPLQVDGFFEQETCRADGGTVRCFTEIRPALDDAADPDPTLDDDDEIVFLGAEVGAQRAPGGVAPPAGVDLPEIRFEVEVRTPQGDVGWVYLFARAGGGNAAYALRTYTTDLATRPGGEQLTPPEDTAIGCADGDPNQITHFASEHFCAHWATRWSLDDLVRRTAESDCATAEGFAGTRLGDPMYEYPDDLLDRWKGHEIEPGADPDDAMWGRCSAMRGERVGPVRYVRGTLGAKSGVSTTVYAYVYPRGLDVETRLGVHAMPGIARLPDWNVHARGGRLYHRHDSGEALTASAAVDGLACGDAGVPPCPAGTDGGFRVYDGSSAESERATTYDALAAGFGMWDYLVTARARVHVTTTVVSDPTAFASKMRFLYRDSAAAPLNPPSNWEEHRASFGSSGLHFDLVRETYTERFVVHHAFRILDPVSDATDDRNLADGEAFADAVRRPLAYVVSEVPAAPGPPASPTDLRIR